MSLDIVTRVEMLEMMMDNTVVTVRVQGAKKIPNKLKEIRARGRALIAAGVLPTTFDTAADVRVGDVSRLTRVSGEPRMRDLGPLREELTYRVIVNREG